MATSVINSVNSVWVEEIIFSQRVQLATLLQREYDFYSWQGQSHYMLYKGSWHIFLIPLSSNSSSLICCPPLSVLSYQSMPCYISLHLSRSSSSNLSLSHFCLYLPISPPPHLFQLFFNQKLFHPIGSVSKYNVANSVTDTHASTLSQNEGTCTRTITFGEPLWTNRHFNMPCGNT